MSSYATTSCLNSVSARRRRRQRFNAESDGEDYSESEKSRSARSTPERSSYEERPARSDSEDDSDDGGQFQVRLINAAVSCLHMPLCWQVIYPCTVRVCIVSIVL